MCTNIGGDCSLAVRHVLVFDINGDRINCSECSSGLQVTNIKKINYGLVGMLLCVAFLIALSVWQLKSALVYETIRGVKFVQPTTITTEVSAVAEVKLTLSKPAIDKLVVNYSMVEGTAKAKDDFNNTGGQIIFFPGQENATIIVSIVPDRDQLEANETFEIILDNVEGKPRHIVIIEEVGVNKDLLQKSHIIVADLSRLAADIANDYATIKMLEEYLNNSLNPDTDIVERYMQAKVNIQRARERYLLQFHDALELDPAIVSASIKNRLAVIEREGASLQYKATELMRKQLFDYIDTRIPIADVWLMELGQLVELPKEKNIDLNSI